MKINRNYYLNQLIEKQNNGLVKIISGMRRCGKSYLLDPMFKNYLLDNGVGESHIIKLDLDSIENEHLLDAHKLYDFICDKIIDTDKYYILLDEIQKVEGFEALLNELKIRGYSVDVGVVEIRDNDNKKQVEIEFVCNLGSKKYYIQSALSVSDDDKKKQELRPLLNVDDFLKKIIITKDGVSSYRNDDGILFLNIYKFLLNENSLEL